MFFDCQHFISEAQSLYPDVRFFVGDSDFPLLGRSFTGDIGDIEWCEISSINELLDFLGLSSFGRSFYQSVLSDSSHNVGLWDVSDGTSEFGGKSVLWDVFRFLVAC